MKSIVPALLGVTLLLTGGCAQRVLVQPSLDVTRYDRIAVLAFSTDSYLSTIGNQLADEIIYNLTKNAPALDVIERERIDDLLREQKLVQQNIVDPASAISLGRLMGVRAISTGSISVTIETIAHLGENRQRIAEGVAIMRVIDTETGKIIWSQREKSQYTTFLGTRRQDYLGVQTDQELIQGVVEELGRNLAQAFYAHYEYR